MAFSYVERQGNGVETSFTFGFTGADNGYIRDEDIVVFVEDQGIVPFTLTGPNSLTLDTPAGDLKLVRIQRKMPEDEPYSDFTRGTDFGQRNVNNSFLQQLYLLHETLDGFKIEDYYEKQDLRMGSYRIRDLADPTDASDAATKAYVDSVVLGGGSELDLTLGVTQSATDVALTIGTGTPAQVLPADATKAGIIEPSQFEKLRDIEFNAKDDQTGSEIIAEIDSEIGVGWKTGGSGSTNLDYIEGTREITSSSGDNVILPLATAIKDGMFPKEDKAKLIGIEDNAKDDQTALEMIALFNTELGGSGWQAGSGSTNTPYANILDFGGVGDGVTDNATAFNAARDSLLSTGGTVYYPVGKWYHNSQATITTTDDTDSGARISVAGDSQGASEIIFGAGATDGFKFLGGTAPTAGVQSYQEIRDLRITRQGSTGAGGGITGDNLAFFNITRCTLSGWNTGISLTDVLSSEFSRVILRWNVRGVRCERVDFSHPNALAFNGCIIGNNVEYGAWVVGGASVVFNGGSVEGNGTTTDSISNWGVLLSSSGAEGAVGLAVHGTYFENNRGKADVWLTGSTYPIAHSFTGVGFSRLSAAAHTTNCILVESPNGLDTRVDLSACGFKSYGDYVPSVTKLTVDWTGDSVNVSNSNSMFEDAVDKPVFPSSGGGGANLGYTASTTIGIVTNDSGDNATIPLAVSGGFSGLFSGAEKAKLGNIETNAKDDQTGPEVISLIDGVLGTGWQTAGGASLSGAGSIFTYTIFGGDGSSATIPAATPANAGVLAGADYAQLQADSTKLVSIASGAQVNVGTTLSVTPSIVSANITSSTGNTITLPSAGVSTGGMLSAFDFNLLSAGLGDIATLQAEMIALEARVTAAGA